MKAPVSSDPSSTCVRLATPSQGLEPEGKERSAEFALCRPRLLPLNPLGIRDFRPSHQSRSIHDRVFNDSAVNSQGTGQQYRQGQRRGLWLPTDIRFVSPTFRFSIVEANDLEQNRHKNTNQEISKQLI